MLPNTKNNSDQVKRMLYSKKVKAKSDGASVDGDDTETATAKKLRDLEEIFTYHSANSNPTDNTFEGSVLLPSRIDAMRPSGKKYIYPFVAASKSNNMPTTTTASTHKPKKTRAKYDVNVCIFRVFDCGGDGQCDPFLQFKLRRQSTKESDPTPNLSFPYTRQPAQTAATVAGGTESAYKTAADQSIKEWFPEHTNIEYKCVRTDHVTGEIYAIYEEMETTTNARYKPETSPMSINDEWWWVCVHEIMNRNKILSLDIHATVIDLFEHIPSAMFLYDSSTGYIMETPHVLYSGITEGSSLDEMILLGPRKLIDNTFFKGDNGGGADRVRVDANERRMYGSQYYLYEYESVFRGACYTTNNKNRYVKRSADADPPPHIFRHAVFLGNTSTVIFDTDNTTTNAAIADVQDYTNTAWCSMNEYKSAHHGKYELSNKRREMVEGGRGGGGGGCSQLDPVFCVCNNERIVSLGYYKINPKSVPVKFDDSEAALDNYELL